MPTDKWPPRRAALVLALDCGIRLYSAVSWSGRGRCPSRSSKPVRRGSPTLGRFDSFATPLLGEPDDQRRPRPQRRGAPRRVVALLDSVVVAGFLDRDDAFHTAAEARVRELAGSARLVVSAITYAELLTGAALGRHDQTPVRGFFSEL